MPVRKIAISVPEDVLADVDELARRLKNPPGQLISRVLAQLSAQKRAHTRP